MSSTNTAIEWTDKTWNPTTGCNKVSPGCKHCYAEALTKRFRNHFKNGFDFTLHPERLDEPKRWRKPSRVFVNSMSDLFHERMPLDFLQKVFRVMEESPRHVFQILTKRHERMLDLATGLDWPENVWLGVSVENQDYSYRVDYLRQTPATVRFLSCEPLIGPLNLDLEGIHWVIVGGESGPKHRPMEAAWARDIREQTRAAGAAFFFKQWGGIRPKAGGREFDGRTYDEMPKAYLAHTERWSEVTEGPEGHSAFVAPSNRQRWQSSRDGNRLLFHNVLHFQDALVHGGRTMGNERGVRGIGGMGSYGQRKLLRGVQGADPH